MTAKILLLEDDLSMQNLLKTFLRFEGFEVIIQRQQESCEQVIEAIQQEKPVAVLMDVNLPKVNGFDVLKAIRAHPELKNTPVIMSSGMDFSERCQAEGADAFMLKPYMPDDLVTAIHKAIASQRSLE
jgi:DNA-binding response OmpR family regulator